MASLRELAHRGERALDRLKWRVSARLGLVGPAMIQPFHGYGDASRLWVKGRVLVDQGVVSAPHSDRLATNLLHTFRRYETDEIPGARLAWSFGSQSGSVTTDAEGFFEVTIQPGGDYDPAAPWQQVHLLLEDAGPAEMRPMGATVRVRTPLPGARYVLVSDIDDTIVKTGATNFLKHWRTVVANSAQSRTGYDGLPELYRALTNGANGAETNPVFYVSSSPWNLFDLFDRYMVLHAIPRGPMLLKDFGLDGSKWLTGGHDGHKLAMIEKVAAAQPDLPLVLIGDSGQRDLEIYARAVDTLGPDRVLAIVIHEVTGEQRREDAADTLARVEKAGVPILMSDDYRAAHRWLEQLGVVWNGGDADGEETRLTRAA